MWQPPRPSPTEDEKGRAGHCPRGLLLCIEVESQRAIFLQPAFPYIVSCFCRTAFHKECHHCPGPVLCDRRHSNNRQPLYSFSFWHNSFWMSNSAHARSVMSPKTPKQRWKSLLSWSSHHDIRNCEAIKYSTFYPVLTDLRRQTVNQASRALLPLPAGLAKRIFSAQACATERPGAGWPWPECRAGANPARQWNSCANGPADA